MKLTADQQAKLELIQNLEQRDMLLDAIRRGLEIPEYAWQPLPANLKMGELFAQMSEGFNEVAGESGVSVDDVNSAMAHEFDLEQFALRAQKTAPAATHFLCDPIELDSPIESSGGCMRLFCWGYFNPMGPTACELTLEIVESTGAFLIVIHSLHPFFPSGTIYGCLPAEIMSKPNEVLECLRILFSKNVDGETRFLGDLPSYVDIPDDSPLSTSHVAVMFSAGFADTSAEEFRESCELMHRYWCKPWERASEERRRAYSDAVARRQQDRPEVATEVHQSFDREVFDQWWTLVTNPEHVKAELREMPAAWMGAIAHQRGKFDPP